MRKPMLMTLVAVITLAIGMRAWATLPEAKKFESSLPSMSNPLSGVPEYTWWNGCSPTSGGMIIGYWDSHPSGNWSNLFEGDSSFWWGTVDNANKVITGTKGMVAGYEHNRSGTWKGHSPNSIADFMKTEQGGTWSNNIPVGLEEYALWDNPNTTTNEAYYSDSRVDEVGYYGGPFSWDAFTTEIDAGNPMLLDVMTYGPGYGWAGHSVVGYGYQDDMFNLKIYTDSGWQNITVGGFAIWDTWDTTSAQSDWLGDTSTVYSHLDADGVEWWPFLDVTETDGWSLADYWDWQVVEGVYFHPGAQVPLPSTILLLASGFGIIGYRGIRWGRNSNRSQS